MYRLSLCFLPILLLSFATLTVQLSAQDASTLFEGGGMRVHVSLHGQIGRSPATDGGGILWPAAGASSRHTRDLCTFSTPVLIGLAGGERRVSASWMRDSFLPGPVIDGQPGPPSRSYTVTWGDEDSRDYREWPVHLGAPVRADGQPFFYGPHQMFWVMNDLDTTAMLANNGSRPLGLEMRCLLYEPWPAALRDNTVLLQVTYINKGPGPITDAHAGYLMDMDIRHPFTDFAASDSLRSMVYAYNSSLGAKEEGMPTAFGLCMLQTPVTAAAGERARWYDGWKDDMRNIPVTAAVTPLKSSTTPIREPRRGYDVYQWYWLLQGRGWEDVSVLHPESGAPSRFWLSGDPLRGTGWLPEHGLTLSDGLHLQGRASDKRVLLAAGPFTLAPGDTQQVTYAFIAARGATTGAAVQMLRDRADFLRAFFAFRPPARAFRQATVHTPDPIGAPERLDLRVRCADPPVTMRVEVSDAKGNVLTDVPLDRSAAGEEWLYTRTVSLPQPRREGVNVSFIAEWDNERVRLPGRVSLPVGGSIETDGIVMLEEGDDNGRVAPDEDAKWFPRLVSHSPFSYRLFAHSFTLPVRQWLHIPELAASAALPSPEHPWSPGMGYNTHWDDTRTLATDSMPWHFDIYDTDANVWWERDNRIPTDSAAGEWYDVLMTQVRGFSDERPGVRLLDLDALENRWYVARIDGYEYDRTLSLYDSLRGLPYFEGFGLHRFTGGAPVVDGFRVVRGTIGSGDIPVMNQDLFIFNPRHVLLARGSRAPTAGRISAPAPQPMTDWTAVTVEVTEATSLRAVVYDALGRRVAILRDGMVDAGRHLLVWDGYWADRRPAESGMYLLRIITDSGEDTRKIMVLR